jgi:hypothetical protein
MSLHKDLTGTDLHVNKLHATTHESGGTDVITVTSLSGFTEAAQDAVGAMVDTTLVYTDATPLLSRAALTGDVTASAGSNVTTIANDAVTFAKMQNVSAASKLLGRGDSGAGDPQEITLGTGLTMTGTTLAASAAFTTEDAQDAIGAMVDSSLTYVDATPLLQRAALTGDVTASAGSNATTIANDAVTYAKIQNVSAASKLIGRGAAGGSGDAEEITVGSGLTMTGTTLSASGSSGGAVTAIASATVATDQTTSSTTYADLATTGPAVTLTTGTDVIVTIDANIYRTAAASGAGHVAVAVSGATTIAAADANSVQIGIPAAGANIPCARTFKLTGLTAGSNTFTLKYKCSTGTFNFLDRDITVMAI